MSLLVIYNPVCGDGKAKEFFEAHVIPYLRSTNSITLETLIAPTTHAEHAGELVVEYLEKVDGRVSIVLGSGDGTLHEIINALNKTAWKNPSRTGKPLARTNFALVPCGTANALYSSLFPLPASLSPDDESAHVSYRLQSVKALVERPTSALPLTLAITTLSPAPVVRTPPQVAVSAVVTSTALHASILYDSEALRATIPGIGRFKTAAMQNITSWYSASVKLFPVPGEGVVKVYDPDTRTLVAHPSSKPDDPIVDVPGPFAYFLSTVNVDRLEPAFRITPLGREAQTSAATMDVVIVRPLRDPSCSWDSAELREEFSKKTIEVMSGAYLDGSHLQMRYAEDGSIGAEGDGETVVEYIRCGGWTWEPVRSIHTLPSTVNGSHLIRRTTSTSAHIWCALTERYSQWRRVV